MKYKCQFPGCNYKTNIRSQIAYHHIVPKELGGSDKLFNRIYLCPNHHTKIFVVESKNGIHSKFGDDSIIIKGWLDSTNGKILSYILNGKEYFYEYK